MPNLYKELNRDQAQDSESFGKNNNNSQNNSAGVKKTQPNFEKYTDTTGALSGTDLKKYLWFTKNRVMLYRLAVSGLVTFSAIMFVYALVGVGYYLIYGYSDDQKLYSQLASSIDYTGANVRYTPQALQILSTETMTSGINKVDAIAEIYNPNEHYLVNFDYTFDFGSTTTTILHATLMPTQTRPVVMQGLDSNLYATAASLSIQNIKWQRISRHDVDDMAKFLDEHLRFTSSEVTYTNASDDTGAGNIINFNLTNDSAFSYRAPEFLVGIFQGGSLAQVIPLKLGDFYSQETKKIDLRSFVPSLNANEVEVYPLINFFDSESYVAPPSL